jgi:tetratricopeptide (TPR) repeat protein
VEIAHSVATTPPPDVRSHAPGLPAAAAEALAHGMAREPAERPRSAGRLAAELAKALEDTPTVPLATRSARAPRPGAPPSAPTPPPPASRPAAATAPPARRRRLAGVLATGLIALAAAAVVAAVMLSSGGGDGDQGGGRAGSTADRATTKPDKTTAEQQQPAAPAPEEPAPAEPAPAEQQPADDPARGIALNEQGFELMKRADFAGAVPVLRRAVASWPEDSTDLDYAYALYNLGTSLNRSGQPAEAIPFLEKRLNWPNQRGVVKKELKDARKNAGQG